MPEYWTVEQAQAQADLLAKEFSNRQILIYGSGEPSIQVPIGVEYEDRTQDPPLRYRKVGSMTSDWKPLFIIEAANTEEVLNGVDDQKMVSPARLSEKLSQFGAEVLGIPQQSGEPSSNLLQLSASTDENNSLFDITLPSDINHNLISVTVTDYEVGSRLNNINGGEVGQIIVLRRGLQGSFRIESTPTIKLSEPIIIEDTDLLDNISLQKITSSIWVELTRKKFN